MNLPLRGVAVYNPSLLSKDELIAQFVARNNLLETILSDLRTQDRPDHRILLGPRGMGKTTLLRRIYFAVEEDPALSKRWIALPFPEEQYNLTRLSDFYLNCVDSLGDALMHLGRVAEAEALDQQRDALADGDETERATTALTLLLRTADKLKRRLLLLVDNVEMVLDRLASSQWTLRELLGHDPRLCLIGASAAAPESTFEYKQAFYEFFRFHELRPLDETEARDLLLHLARLRKASEIERILTEEPARVRTLLTLSGGNPRTLVQLYGVLAQASDGDARSDLERLLDECTPIYKARFEALSIQAQQIVDAVALKWHPASAADLAAATRLDVNIVTSQLSRLNKDGVLEAVQAPEGSRKAYQLAERFFNIWYLMRASRRQRQRLVWLVEFLRLLYSQDDLAAHARRTVESGPCEQTATFGRDSEYRMTLAQAVEDRALKRALVSSAVLPWADIEGQADKLTELLDLAPDQTPAKPIADRHRAMADLRKKILKAKVKKKGWDAAEFWDLLGGALLPIEKKASMVARLEKVTSRTVATWTSALHAEAASLKRVVRCDVADTLRRAIREGHMHDVADLEGGEAAALLYHRPELTTLVRSAQLTNTKEPAEEAFQRLEQALQKTPSMAYGWFALAKKRADIGQYVVAETAYRKGLEQDPDLAAAWRELGILLYLYLKPTDLIEAETALRRALQLDPGDPEAWGWLGRLLTGDTSRRADAESALRQAIALDALDPWTWIWLGDLLINRPREAEEACRQAVTLSPELGAAWKSLGKILEARQRYAEAESAYRRAASEKEPYEWAWLALGNMMYTHLGRSEDAEQAYRAALAFEDTRPFALHYIARNRRQRCIVDTETEQVAREMVKVDPTPDNKLLLASILVRRGLWDEPARIARETLTPATPEKIEAIWGATLDFFSDVILAKGAPQALQLLEDLGFSERWLPLRAALTAIRDGKRALAGFAPEVRRPAETLLASLQPTPTTQPTSTTPTAPATQPRSTPPRPPEPAPAVPSAATSPTPTIPSPKRAAAAAPAPRPKRTRRRTP